MLPANTILSGRYKLLDTLGAGGAATVYRAQDQRLGRIVAVKVLRPEYVADA
jgi:eukaryotic-like serine/threonine-protein kinase